MIKFDTIIIGTGPAGLFTACYIDNGSVLIIEQNDKPGKKLLVAGAGQCNFTHAGDINDIMECYHDGKKFLKKALTEYDNKDVMRFFKNKGVDYVVMENNKVFPKSLKSIDILNALLDECRENDVKINYNEKLLQVDVVSLEENAQNAKDTNIATRYIVTTDKNQYECNNIVFATGGKSYPNLGSTGSCFKIIEGLGHTITPLSPGLVGLTLDNNPFKELSGIAVRGAKVSVYRDNKKLIDYTQDLLFTHRGVSGPAIINISRYMRQGDVVYLNFLNREYEEVKSELLNGLQAKGSEEINTFLKQFDLPKALNSYILEYLELDLHTYCAKISKDMRNKLATALTKYEIIINKPLDFNTAMVTNGGVKLKEVNPTTMESRKHKGLFFAGEVLDIDGITGGYNIQAAFSTAYLCACHINKQ